MAEELALEQEARLEAQAEVEQDKEERAEERRRERQRRREARPAAPTPGPSPDEMFSDLGTSRVPAASTTSTASTTASTTAEAAPPEAADCNLAFVGKARKPVKLRTRASGEGYVSFHSGSAISVPDWFNLTCSLDAKVPRPVPQTTPIPDVETLTVALQAYLLAARFEADGDHDIHCQLGAVPDWDTEQVIVEIPPGQEWCEARTALWDLVQRDFAAAGGRSSTNNWILRNPVPVLVTGYVFCDSAHGGSDFCNANGGRGIQKPGDPGSKVRGLWELHPVISVQAASEPGPAPR